MAPANPNLSGKPLNKRKLAVRLKSLIVVWMILKRKWKILNFPWKRLKEVSSEIFLILSIGKTRLSQTTRFLLLINPEMISFILKVLRKNNLFSMSKKIKINHLVVWCSKTTLIDIVVWIQDQTLKRNQKLLKERINQAILALKILITKWDLKSFPLFRFRTWMILCFKIFL